MTLRLITLVLLATAGFFAIACGDGAKRDDSGQIVDEGELGVFDFEVGDCFQDPENLSTGSAGIADVQAVPCSTPHDNEVFYLHDLSNEFSDFPGEAQIDQTSAAACLAQFEGYVGKDYESSRFDFVWLSPTALTWEENDDREVVCILFDAQLAELTGSMRDSGE